MAETWHNLFDPRGFLARVDIECLIRRNEARNENFVECLGRPCVLCGGSQTPGLLLNDKSYLCKPCLAEIGTITYPERYERLNREYLKNREARAAARKALIDQSSSRKLATTAAIAGWFSLLLFFVNPFLLAVPVALFLIQGVAKRAHEKKLAKWEAVFPVPTEPKMRHFHDPLAELTGRDHAILKVFNNWPGYPPFWDYLREVVLGRDDDRCQVSGCPSRVERHVHHRQPVSQGGEHIPSNLVTLCAFHHALEPDEGHDRVWGKIKTNYFTMVRSHLRRNPSSGGYHTVCAHLRRLELVGASELSKLIVFYGMRCPSCLNGALDATVDKEHQQVSVACPSCSQKWTGPRGLTEETGPRLADLFIPTQHIGNWKPRWDMLEKRRDSTFRLMAHTRPTHKSQKRATIKSKKAK